MKKMLLVLSAILIVVVSIFAFSAIPAKAAYSSLGPLKYSIEDREVTIQMCDTSTKGISIPSMIDGYPVTRINDYAFQYCSDMEYVTIPSGVKSIGSNAFQYCGSLKSVHIPSTVTSIGLYAFANCGLEQVTLSNSITKLYPGCFSACRYLKSIVIPDSVEVIHSNAFENCESLESITIGDSVTSIDDGAFEYCSSLKKVNITDVAAWCNISFGDHYANPLQYAKNLYLNNNLVTNLVIPDGVTSIGNGAFAYCRSLTSVTIPNSVTSIGSAAFYNCDSLTKVNISDVAAWCNISFENGSANPLYYAKNLYLNNNLVTELVIPDGVTSIGNGAFAYCRSLTSVTIPNSVTNIGSEAFDYCTNLKNVFYDCCEKSWDEISLSDGNEALINATYIYADPIEITEEQYLVSKATCTTKSIYSKSCPRCGSATEQTFEYGETEPHDYAENWTTSEEYHWKKCNYCDAITENGEHTGGSATITEKAICKVCGVAYGELLPNLNGWYFEKTIWKYYEKGRIVRTMSPIKYTYTVTDGKATITGCPDTVSGLLIIPPTIDGYPVTAIGYEAFYNNTRITSVVISEGVTSISADSFWNCSNITSVTIPDSVTVIGSCAFLNCSSMKTVDIGSGVKTVYSRAFGNCTALTKVNISDIAVWCGISFGSNGANPLEYSKKLYLNNELVTELVIPDGVTSIGDYAFCGCGSLTSVDIPKTVTSIGIFAFSKCGSLEKVNMDIEAWCYISFGNTDANPLYFGNYLYLNNELVTELVIPVGVTSIGDYAFTFCDSIISVIIPDSVITIGEYAFNICGELSNVDIGDNVTSIGKYAFHNCSRIKSIVIPDSVTSIGLSAFFGCHNMAKISFGKGLNTISDAAFFGCSNLKNIYYRGSIEDREKIFVDTDNGYLDTATWHYNSCLNFASHTGGYATCGKKANCSICGNEYGELEPHTATNKVEDKFFVSKATCTSKETYNKSCKYCGRVMDGTFEIGETEPHDYLSVWTTTGTEHWRKCNNCDDITEKGEHIGGTATCTKKAVCVICDAEYGSAKGHTITEKADEKYLVSGATCTAKAVYNKSCLDCGIVMPGTFEYGLTAPHDYAETWTTSSTEHWRKCNNCDDVTEKGEHTGGTATCTEKAVCAICEAEYGSAKGHTITEKADKKYLVSGATCTAKAVYNKSCFDCGIVMEGTFEFGETEPHDYSDVWTPTGTEHWRKCNNCDDITEKGEHIGGTATCTKKAVCVICDAEYGSAKGHTITEKADEKYLVSGATCTSKAVYNKSCLDCGIVMEGTFEYGETDPHDYAETWTITETEHWRKCNNCDDVTEKGEHIGGVATCTSKAVCSVCNSRYGEAKGHTSTEKADEKYLVSGATCTSKAIYNKSCFDCGIVMEGTFEFGETAPHDYAEIWTTSETEHWRKCNNCDDVTEKGEHIGGTATVTEKAKCEVCNAPYGEMLPNENGWVQEGDHWYYYENGVKVKNSWREDSNGWCFLDEEGRWVLNSFVKDSTNKWAYITKDGYYYETTGWVEYDGHWYYLEKGYRVENDWRKDSTGWCFLDEEGKWVLNSFVKDSTGMWAYITPDGYYYETTGWIEYDGGWYYLEKGYAVTSQWRKDSIGWCYLSESGRMVTNDFVPDSNGLCYIGGEGYMLEVTGWQLHNDQWYYLQNGYAVTNDWRLDSKGWCYLGEDGAMLTSTWFRDSVGWCYIDENGYCLANGTYEVDGHEYTFDADGRIQGEPIQE